MTISGKSLIAGQWVGETDNGFTAFHAQTNEPMATTFCETTAENLEVAIERAHDAFTSYSQVSAEQKAKFLTEIGEQILALGDALIKVACAETGLPEARIIGERGRTIGQLNLFAKHLLTNEYDAVIDHADSERTPLPKPDTRLGYIPLGVVAVFGASNFPLAFSTAGGDTASALAAGCPVVMKSHVAHPGTSELVAQAISKAIQRCELDQGVFSLIQGKNYGLATQLVQHPFIKAVGFTGSERVGLILQAQINERKEPIPFYGELGSVNPQFILPNHLSSQPQAMAQRLVESMLMGQGQFCTSPGLWIVIENEHYSDFEQSVNAALISQPAGVMLTRDIQAAYQSRIEQWHNLEGVKCIASGEKGEAYHCQAAVFSCDLDTFIRHNELNEEVFGPAALIIKCSDEVQMQQMITLLKGNLTASVHADPLDMLLAQQLALPLTHKVGRLIFNQMPTGVEVCASMNHGGPFPASTDVRTTSVGTKAIERFRRPICFQNMPESLLPDALKDKCQPI